ncbi:MAG: hypothetical protein IT428_04335 [Planctomycetaceae bacterium]|nr:hypothetical protein [Planctomycetaceae bacterium]
MNMAGLKNINWKRVGIDHGEKIVLGIIGLSMLTVVAAGPKPWDTEKRDPNKLVTNVSESQTKVKASVWPDAEKAKYATQSGIGERVTELMTPVDVAKYSYKTDIIWPLVRREEPIREPEWLAVDQPIATSGRVTLVLKPNSGPSPDELQMAEAADPANGNAVNDEFAVRQNNQNRGGAAGALGPVGAAVPPMGVRNPMGAATATDVLGAMGPGGEGVGSTISEQGKGYRFAAIRAVIPYRRQADRIAKASHELISRSYDKLQYLDFELERKTAVAGNDPWSGPWEPVNIKVALEVIRDADFDEEVVESSITDPVVTMPLPLRAQGTWDNWANHPLLEGFALSEEGKELQRLMTEQLLEYERQAQLAESRSGPVKKGFSIYQRDVRGLQQVIANNAANATGFGQFLQNDPMSLNPLERARNDRIKKKVEVTAAGQYLLFRYFDFDVAPNNAYKYRVRLKIANPNYGLSPDQVVAPFVAEKEERLTPWSTETNPVVIGDDVQYFLTKIDPKGGYTAQFNVYQWNPATGVPVHDETLKVVYGQPIAATKETKVIYAPTHTKKEPFSFNTGDTLVDSTEMALLSDIGLHSDLKLPGDPKHKFDYTEKVLLVNEFGELLTTDPDSTRSRAERTKSRFNAQTSAWDDLTDPSETATQGSKLDELANAAAPMGPMPGVMTDGKSKKKNLTKKTGAGVL